MINNMKRKLRQSHYNSIKKNKTYLCLYSHFRDKANVVKRRLITEALLRCVLIAPFRGDEECASVVTVLD